MPGSGDSFQDWLDDFKKEVEAAVSVSGPATGPAAEQARRDFDNWWDARQDPLATPLPNPDIQQLEAAISENSRLRTQLTEAQRAAAAERESASLQGARLDVRASALQEQIESLRENKVFLEETARQAEAARDAASHELKLERERGLIGAQENVSLKHQAADREAELVKLRQTLAAREGTLEELRRQAGVYQDRLVTAKELTDQDVALLRQELKLFLEEFRIMMHTIKKGT